MIKIDQLHQGAQQMLTTPIKILVMKLYFLKIIRTLLVHVNISSVYGTLQKKKNK